MKNLNTLNQLSSQDEKKYYPTSNTGNNINNKNTDLVIWGDNLSSTVGTGRFTKIVKNMIKLPPCQCGALVGLILSDGWLACSYFLLSFIPLSIGTNIEGKENKLKKLHPYYATGFADAESSFVIAVYKDTKYKTGWRVIPLFKIELHQRDIPLLKKIQSFYGVGIIVSTKEIIMSFIL